MKKIAFALFMLFLAASAAQTSCKTAAKAAARHWTKKQIRKFSKNCEEKVSQHFSSEKIKPFCDCASQSISDKFDLEKANAMDAMTLIKEAGKCALQIP